MKIGLKFDDGGVSWRAEDADAAGMLRLRMLRESVGMDTLTDDGDATCRIVPSEEFGVERGVGIPRHGMRVDFSGIAERGAERDAADAEQTAKFLLGGKDGILRQIAGKDGVKDRIPGLAVLEFGVFEDHANLILGTCIILVILFGIYHSPCGFQERE